MPYGGSARERSDLGRADRWLEIHIPAGKPGVTS